MKARARLVFVTLSTTTIMLVGIQNLLTRPWAFAALILAVVCPMVAARAASVAGVTRQNLAQALTGGVAVGVAYGILRGLALAHLGDSEVVLGADLMRMVPTVETGIRLGGLTVSGQRLWVFLLLLLPIGFAGIELFFRGIVFLDVRQRMHWAGAVVVAAAAQAVARRTPHSLIMGSLAGLLMQKYDNIAAPIVMHGTQFFIALAIVLRSR